MTPSMAAMVPGGCTPVAASECAPTTPAPTSGQQYSWNTVGTQAPGTLPVNQAFEGPANLIVKAYEPTERRLLPGVKVDVSLLNNQNQVIIPNIGSGYTDASGQWSMIYQAPAPAQQHYFKVRVSPGPNQNFPAIDGILPARTAIAASAGNSMMDTLEADFIVCPSGVENLVCDVAAAQFALHPSSNRWVFASGGGDSRIAAGQFEDPKLRAHFDIYGNWIGDFDILPKEWPELVKNFEQMWSVWAAVPWPKEMVKDLFVRCAKNIKLYKDWSVFDLRLYSPKYSDFFPKTDEEIRRIIAYKALNAIPSIYDCMQHLVQRKIEKEAKNAKKWNLIGMAAGMLFTGNIIGGLIFKLATELKTFNNALDFSKFMMGYQEFVEECRSAEEEDFTCKYLGPFVLWAMEVLHMNQFFDNEAAQAGLPGAQPGLTQEQVIKPMVTEMKAQGVDVPLAAYTPGGVAPKVDLLPVVGGVGFVGLLALIGSALIK